MKNFIIKLLGGFEEMQMKILLDKLTESNYINDNLLRKSFRKGDKIYITGDSRFYEGFPYFLLSAYNSDTCWIVGKSINDDPNVSALSWGVHIEKIKDNPPEKCRCCNQIISIKSATELK